LRRSTKKEQNKIFNQVERE